METTQQQPNRIRLRLDLAYDGTNFHGWAKQAPGQGVRTVQQHLEQALETIVRHPVSLTVAGRTDAGVHATGQVAHVDIDPAVLRHRSIGGDASRLVRRLAKLTDPDVRVHNISVAPEGFDARFSALSRSYRYRVATSSAGPLPTHRFTCAWWPKKVELNAIQRAIAPLVGLHDFAAFSKYRPGATTVRTLLQFTCQDVSTPQEPDTFEFFVKADAFTWSMVRSLVGAALVVGEGKRDESFLRELLELRERSPLVPVAPACGLTLCEVAYPPTEELAARAQQTRGIRVLAGEEYRAVGKGCPETNPHYYRQ